MGTLHAISLFSGAGGLDYGFEAAGFSTRVAVEMDKDCCETLRNNRFAHVIERSIFDVPGGELLDVCAARRGDVGLVIGGPPCQPFSKSGYWAHGDAKRLADPRAGTLGAFLRVVEDTLPRVCILENVEGLAYTEKNEGLAFVLHQFTLLNRRTKSNYSPQFKVLCAADYGVPQLRNRLFLVAAKDGAAFQFPEPTHSAPSDEKQLPLFKRQPHKTSWDAIGDVAPAEHEDLGMRGKWADLLRSIPEGENYLWHTERGGGLPLFGWRRRYWSFLLKLAKDRPSWTIQAQPGPSTGPFHWSNRRLSMRELCRIQTFPDKVSISGNYRAIHRQVGNAVPSLLGEILGLEIRRQLFGDRIRSKKLSLLPPYRTPVPQPEAPRSVASKYRVLQGAHSPHPGTGKGYRASTWA